MSELGGGLENRVAGGVAESSYWPPLLCSTVLVNLEPKTDLDVMVNLIG